jgi:hypothetical protein
MIDPVALTATRLDQLSGEIEVAEKILIQGVYGAFEL